MFRISNTLSTALNAVAALLSSAVFAIGILLATRGATDCEKLLDKPAIAIGALLIVVSVAGLVGSCFRIPWLLFAHLAALLLIIVLALCFTVFAFAVTNRGAGEALSGRGFREYRLGDYLHWLQRRVVGAENWPKIKSCIRDYGVCYDDDDETDKKQGFDRFVATHLSPIKSACCKPPTACNSTYELQETAAWWSNPPGSCRWWLGRLQRIGLRHVEQRSVGPLLRLPGLQGRRVGEHSARLEEVGRLQRRLPRRHGRRLLRRMLRLPNSRRDNSYCRWNEHA